MLLAAAAGVLWGSMSVAAQHLMQTGAFIVNDLVSFRMLGAGIVLLLWEALSLRGRFFALIRRFAAPFLVYGIGMLCIQWTFFEAISVSNAATAALMVTFGPLFVTGWTAFSERRSIRPREWLAIALAAAGVVLIVTKGDFSSLDMNAMGAFWGILSSASGAFCTVQPRRILPYIPVGLLVGIGMTIGGGLLTIIDPPNLGEIRWTLESALLYGYIALFGTVGAFCCYLKSLEFIPAPTTALLGSFEPLSALFLGTLLLGISFGPMELLGAALILTMVAVLARGSK